uniref:Uncharacterized protein n=1 Tax=Haptolina brevifila TaxID=156173 RepID=A0A7S2IZQ4_9EUKA|mmetsp:Transcript_74309/g.147646  ORF Transcript_74309/g.147646 Transcript_74309/m.147646 type:complete len:118 (+) Transcript_74309:510-863(+)
MSSVEHSGLGRYNDGLNPWGDILAIARTWCISAPDARLVIAVPTASQFNFQEPLTDALGQRRGRDVLEWNAHRTYGPVRYPYLMANWELDRRIQGDSRPAWGHTVYVFTKVSRMVEA